MKKAIILDTNFIIENGNGKSLNNFKNKVKDYADIFIPKIVIEEVKSQKARDMNENIIKLTT